MTYRGGLSDRGLRREPSPVDKAFADIGIDGEVTDVERRQVLKEVRALRRLDLEALEARSDEHAAARDLAPRPRDAEPRIRRAPPADADEDVRFSCEVGVEPRQLVRGLSRRRPIEAMTIDDDHVGDLDPTVAE